MSVTSQSSQAVAANMAAQLGFTEMNMDEVTRMLQLGERLYPMFQISIAFLVLTWLAVSLRVYARAVVIKSFGWDDWMMLVSICVFSCCCACLIAIENIQRSDAARKAAETELLDEFSLLRNIYQLILAFMALYVISTVVLKISLAIFFLRVIPHGWQRKALYIATTIYTAYGIFFTFIVIFQCGNPNDFFMQEARGKCIPDNVLQPLYYAAGGMNALTDWIFSLLPVTVIWNATIPRSTKISAGCLLGLGSLASISSLIRLAYIPGIQASPTFLEHAVNIASWSIVEPGLGIIAASLATLRPLFMHCFPSRKSILPTTNTAKAGASMPGTFASRRSFEDSINPFADVKLGSITTIVGNARKQEAKDMRKKQLEGAFDSMTSVTEVYTNSEAASIKSRPDCGTGVDRSPSQKFCKLYKPLQVSWLPGAEQKKENVVHGCVIMTKDFSLAEEMSATESRPSSPRSASSDCSPPSPALPKAVLSSHSFTSSV